MQRRMDQQLYQKYSYLERSPEDHKLKKRYVARYDQSIENRYDPGYSTIQQTFNTQFSPYRAHPSKQISPKNRKMTTKNEQPILIQEYENTQKKLIQYHQQNRYIKQKLLVQQVQSLRRQLMRKQEDHVRSINQVRQQIKTLLMKNMILQRDLAQKKIKQQLVSPIHREVLIRQFSTLLHQREAQFYMQKQFIKKIKEMKVKMNSEKSLVVNQNQSLRQLWRWIKRLGHSFSYLQNWVDIVSEHYGLQGSNIEELTASIQALLP